MPGNVYQQDLGATSRQQQQIQQPPITSTTSMSMGMVSTSFESSDFPLGGKQ